MVYAKALEFAGLYCDWFLTEKKIELDRKLTRSEAKNLSTTWRIGFAMGLKQKFDEQVDKNNWGLMVVTPDSVIQYMKENYDKMSKRQSSRQNIHDDGALQDGIDKGKKFGSNSQDQQKESAGRGPKLLAEGN